MNHRLNFLTQSKKYIYEFIVIFFGVYLAFIFTEFQQRLNHREIRLKYYDSIIVEFKVFSAHLDRQSKSLQPMLEIIDAIDNKKTPQLLPIYTDYLYRGMVVKAAFNSQNFESLDFDTLRSIIGGTQLLEMLEKDIQKFNRLQEALIIPFDRGQADFFDKDGQLRQKYGWYPFLGKRIYELNRELKKIVTNQAIPGMEQQKKELAEKYFWQI